MEPLFITIQSDQNKVNSSRKIVSQLHECLKAI